MRGATERGFPIPIPPIHHPVQHHRLLREQFLGHVQIEVCVDYEVLKSRPVDLRLLPTRFEFGRRIISLKRSLGGSFRWSRSLTQGLVGEGRKGEACAEGAERTAGN